MLKSVQYWVVVGLAAVCVVLAAMNAGLYFIDRSAQAQVNVRARYIQQSQSIGSLYQEIAKALAQRAIDSHDEEVKALLTAEGFTITPTAADAARAGAGVKP